MRDLNK